MNLIDLIIKISSSSFLTYFKIVMQSFICHRGPVWIFWPKFGETETVQITDFSLTVDVTSNYFALYTVSQSCVIYQYHSCSIVKHIKVIPEYEWNKLSSDSYVSFFFLLYPSFSTQKEMHKMTYWNNWKTVQGVTCSCEVWWVLMNECLQECRLVRIVLMVHRNLTFVLKNWEVWSYFFHTFHLGSLKAWHKSFVMNIGTNFMLTVTHNFQYLWEQNPWVQILWVQNLWIQVWMHSHSHKFQYSLLYNFQ